MNILITAPSLDSNKNVSGVAAVAGTIIKYNFKHNYTHYLLGSPDRRLNKFSWVFVLLKQLLLFPFFLKNNKIDLVHQNLPFDPKGLLREFIINKWCMVLRTPVFLHIHGGEFLMNKTGSILFRWISKSIFKNSHQVVVLSELERIALAENYDFYDAQVLSNSINTSLYISEKKNYNIEKPVFLFLGRIHESKGVPDIIEALKLLKEKFVFEFHLCGVGPMKEQLIAACEDFMGEDFKYFGVVSGSAKIEIIKGADYFLLPSRYGEGLPIALLETMAAGVVPIVTDDASMKYVVQDQVNGIKVNKNDPRHIFEKMSNMLSQPSSYYILSKNAQEDVTRNYDIGNYLNQLNALYSNI